MKPTVRSALVLGMACLISAVGDKARAAEKVEVHFNQDIRPILSNRCFKCHGEDLKKAGLDLQTAATATKKLKGGEAAIVPGDVAKSELLIRVTSQEKPMPPKGDPLTPEQIAKLKGWIEQGAKYEEHWAYVKPVQKPLPELKNKTWPRNGLDGWILARLEQEGLAPSPEADKLTLLRSVGLDLTGLPPTPQELDAFLADASPGAYEKAVDRLLSSPAYGEHMARYWLDLARYADTNGYEKDDRRTAWPYRDWIINAFNRNMPFDQFTVEQIAGDLLPPGADAPGSPNEKLIATGFHRNTMVNTEGGTDDEEFRIAAIVDRVNTTMTVWMGTTSACTQCHNHKFDPFKQKEFYQLFAFFNGTADLGKSNAPELSLPTPEQAARIKTLQDSAAALKKSATGSAPILGGAGFHALQLRAAALEKEAVDVKPASTLVMQELPQERPTHIMLRGNFKSLGEEVKPGVPAKLNPLPAGAPANRLGLAKWLVDLNNPLTARVFMNRMWAHHFGTGLVVTSDDFGTQGEPPMHPELLDWLAVEFMNCKWDIKAMHKLIVMSATYRQASKAPADLLKRDPFNRLYARGPRFRMDAEMVRDNALAISGLLNRKIGGPSVFPYQPDGVWFNPYSGDKWAMSSNGDQHRRGLYTFCRRTAPYAEFSAFDAPSREICTERRSRTNTPLQALAVLNDKVYVEASAALARRITTEAKGDPAERAAYGFRLCTSRTPTTAERDLLMKLYAESLAKYQKDATAALAMAKNGGDVPKGADAAELAAWTVVANVLLNMDETITKG